MITVSALNRPSDFSFLVENRIRETKKSYLIGVPRDFARGALILIQFPVLSSQSCFQRRKVLLLGSLFDFQGNNSPLLSHHLICLLLTS